MGANSLKKQLFEKEGLLDYIQEGYAEDNFCSTDQFGAHGKYSFKLEANPTYFRGTGYIKFSTKFPEYNYKLYFPTCLLAQSVSDHSVVTAYYTGNNYSKANMSSPSKWLSDYYSSSGVTSGKTGLVALNSINGDIIWTIDPDAMSQVNNNSIFDVYIGYVILNEE